MEPVPAPIADEITVDRFAETGFEPNHFTIASTCNDVASEGTVNAEGAGPLKIPSPPGKPGGLIRIDTCRAKIDEVPGKGAFQGPIFETAEIGVVRNLHGPQVAIPGDVLIEPAASPAVNAAIHLMPDKDAQVLITISPLFPQIAPDPVASGHRHVLEQTMSAFIADRTVVGMVHHEPFDHMPSKIDDLIVDGRYGHAIGSVHHAAHLDPFDRAFQELHGTHPTGADRPEPRMVAEPWDDDAQPRRGLDHLRSLFDFYFDTVNL
jgi:hypothetical protein